MENELNTQQEDFLLEAGREKDFERKLEFETPVVEQKESLKLCKNTKGYNWEIRILSCDLDRLEKLNDEMKKRFEYSE
jgi:hypothetical protein